MICPGREKGKVTATLDIITSILQILTFQDCYEKASKYHTGQIYRCKMNRFKM